MSAYGFHPEALIDLDEIWEYIAEDNPATADRVIDEFERLLRLLFLSITEGINAQTSHHDRCGSFWYANI